MPWSREESRPRSLGPPWRGAIEIELLAAVLVVDHGLAVWKGLLNALALADMCLMLYFVGWHAGAGVVLPVKRGLVHAAVEWGAGG